MRDQGEDGRGGRKLRSGRMWGEEGWEDVGRGGAEEWENVGRGGRGGG